MLRARNTNTLAGLAGEVSGDSCFAGACHSLFGLARVGTTTECKGSTTYTLAKGNTVAYACGKARFDAYKDLQKAINLHGFNLTIDGAIGNTTRLAAVKAMFKVSDDDTPAKQAFFAKQGVDPLASIPQIAKNPGAYTTFFKRHKPAVKSRVEAKPIVAIIDAERIPARTDDAGGGGVPPASGGMSRVAIAGLVGVGAFLFFRRKKR